MRYQRTVCLFVAANAYVKPYAQSMTNGAESIQRADRDF